ncbi:MAG TPA: peptidylprolyl isomerase [Blastocatellia bacterium]|nr:peptidylprolyl isomerase [Blastocatellia bacterium]
MRTKSLSLLLLLMIFLLLLSSCASKDVDDEVAVLETNYGRIVIEFLPKVAPKQVENFKSLAREGFYDGTKFHRIVKDKTRPNAIQGGDPNTINGDPSIWGQGQRGQKTVPAEFSQLKHVRGIVSAARRSDDINSATSQFFICVAPQPSFDNQYSIFGRVIEGMNVVDSIALAPTEPKSERPTDPVVVNRAYVVKRTELR